MKIWSHTVYSTCKEMMTTNHYSNLHGLTTEHQLTVLEQSFFFAQYCYVPLQSSVIPVVV